ncbi:MAG: hypothetical protein IPH07_17925 [Deltaproteobacteria bacterium]|nr:hypothetical protein [Deltaproteobacteria bacterium]MBK8238697.1 hypothetical protein [Deltaproteobacteria bacterium]MBK8715578.1 hypothetical protein [Deltaproteobacteria bacterium]
MFVLGCGAPAGDVGPGDTTSTSAATQGSSSGSSSDASTTTTTAQDGSTGAPVGDGVLQCVETCEVPSECCLPGTACPGPYPSNVDCVDGLCVRPQCDDDASCTAIDPAQTCALVGGLRTCVTACAEDGDCAALGDGYTCSADTDDGAAICFLRCDAPGVICGNQTCDAGSGLCACASSGQCQSDWVCVD